MGRLALVSSPANALGKGGGTFASLSASSQAIS
jgi:hypothetical protein